MSKANHIVITTINVPVLLWDYQRNLDRHGHLDDTKVWVVGDRKTPPEVRGLCAELSRSGLETVFLGIDEQDDWGKTVREFYGEVPYNNDTRRIVGYLFALEDGCERLIVIDDDNWPTADDFIGGHLAAGSQIEASLIREGTGFHNVCEYLEFDPQRRVYPRGYPFKLRGSANSPQPGVPLASVTIGVNAGLWLREPDVDAITWLNGAVTGTGFSGSPTNVLAQDTWTPINTQNTSVVRDLIPAFLCVPMGWAVPGGMIHRYGDIWGGYFLEAILPGTPYHVAFGRPLVDHRRNPHDYLDDLRFEYWGMLLTDWLLHALKERFRPTAEAIPDRVQELAGFLEDETGSRLPRWCPEEMRHFLLRTGRTLRGWAGVCRLVG